MAVLAVQQIVKEGAAEAALVAAAAGGDSFFNDGKTFFKMLNGDVSPVVITIVAPKLSRLGASQNVDVTVPASGEYVAGPFPVSAFNTDGANEVEVTYPSVTSLTVGAFSVNDAFN